MGYTTDFHGSFKLDKPLIVAHKLYLEKFSGTRCVQRNLHITANRYDPARLAVGLPIGLDGGYFVGEGGKCGQDNGSGVYDGNKPPVGQPGLWCQWVPTDDGTGIAWNECEKFYDYTEWLEYLIEHFLKPWGYVLNGKVSWQGEEGDDQGVIHVSNNRVKAVPNEIISPEPSFDD